MNMKPKIDFTQALSGQFDLRGKTAYIPGGEGGIDETKALAVAAALQTAGYEALGLAMDAHCVPQMQSSVDAVAQHFGGLDILVNCVGMQREEALLEVTEAAFDEVIQVNLKAAMFLAQASAKHQIAGGRGGAQVHLLSVRAQLGLRARGYSAQ